MRAAPRAVAVTGMHRGENPQPGAAVVASLRRAFPHLRVLGFSYDPMESSLYGSGPDHPDAAYLMPFPGAGAEALLERLDAVRAREDLGYVIPCLDSEIENYIALQPRLRERGVECILPSRESFEARHKANLYEFCRRNHIPAPVTLAAADPAAVEDCAARIGYPVYVKGRLYHAHLVYSREGLAPAYDEIVQSWGWPVIVQENLVGEEYDVTGVGDGRGRILGSCSIRKLLRTANGKGFAGIVVEDERLDALAQRIVQALKWNGPFELEFVQVAGRPHALMEINPRFPAWIDFPSQLGCNLPALLFRRLLHRRARALPACRAGQMFVRHSLDVAGDFAEFAAMASAGERVFHPAIPASEAAP
ncbi:MAG TPA: ATP-grasp domain-containing protein [Ramlibacter sp.]|uniref:ATP-grasp domain-containing protein n=1 Tax=Ramlibacter sp. TaxID=1917967 RepID=UPI002D80B919|nr:ATP-grasp domain-containing protein [Ramlibacter sp.]HET8746389.1 ATP-grasp domain-containing protein [Ramlibacter sp.]